MAEQQLIGNFIIAGMKDLVFRDRETKEVEASIDKLTNITINDSQTVEFVRGGYTNPKLIPIYGDRDSTFEAQNATINPELLRIMMNTPQKTGATHIEKPAEDFTLTATVHTATLTDTPEDADLVAVYVLDNVGHKSAQLTLSTSATPSEGEFYINGKELTFPESLVGRVKVHYSVAKDDVAVFEVSDITPISWDIHATVVFKEYESGKAYLGEIHIPNGSVQPNYSLSGANEATVPDAIPVTIDMMMDENAGYPYRLVIDKNAVA